MNPIDTLLNGAIDMHVHFGPESLVERRQNAFQLAQTARDMHMRAIVIKNREYNTVPSARLVNELVPDFQLFGSLSLDNEVGGVNPIAVISAVKMGAKVIWMPVFTSANSKPYRRKNHGHQVAWRHAIYSGLQWKTDTGSQRSHADRQGLRCGSGHRTRYAQRDLCSQ